ncbi:ArsR family transcriptional regulator [Candidatus Methanocrinis natronophilus]|uniref:ArsR family transcriptional regulator n=1 Tax=Candidatus Methanocrinis natronophilus TaxID=3033396 RepID=A0ABT5X4S8_9EURY|nr:ArsR family transcriptional regulator [Candidatus Methanocrinis natronophilus]MDF0589691.1 ArsR family transcriptional regulator [Candidatus Methanocrinis natronophilus]
MLDNEDIEFADILHSLGMQRRMALIVTYLANVGEASSREIGYATRLSQPEVSVAVRDLRDENLVSELEVKTGGKGRPSLVYTLIVPIDDIIKWFENEKLREHTEVMENLQKLKGMVSSRGLAAEPS